MLKWVIAPLLVAEVLAGCTEYSPPNTYTPAAAPVSVASGPEPGVVAAPANVFQGAAVGAAIAGLPGAVWADPNNTGYVTGYTLNGRYYPGAPPGYDPTRHQVVRPH